ncbi:1-phosphofructokinase family hexose kinase [Microbacterium ureisolvens]|uniref:Bifunctional hydroxymethylpyrimidine kinase/phosphomethylpyrimidine kinase n=1 Tax=Microbacterium ureisolvens TaxID=2781186 RepID=A0ABS7HWY8_9MICO|nr:PfkB family carbohydrate kinase [Microbacterium ureisolvens]MBW9109884.1 bifunctional hydroxymethylpyrimidine kinase/phosphomethylpyrimidine kinase [Microbacterium ureisolvens]
MSDVTIFAPSPTLTVTVEEHDGEPDIHLHAGGQGVWQARMLVGLGASVTMCCTLTGEIGRMLRHLLEDEGLTVVGVERPGKASAYVHDRRGGERRIVAESEGEPLARHDLDELYGVALRDGLQSGLVILSGPAGGETLPADTYRRLAADLRRGGAKVVVDLAGKRLVAALEGGVDVLKVSEEELVADGLLVDGSPAALLATMRDLHRRGAAAVIVSRGSKPLLLLDSDGFVEVESPRMEVADMRGAGDSLTAGVAAGLARGESVREAVVTGAAAGALNVTRHGLGTGDPETIEQLRESVTVRELVDNSAAGVTQPVTGHVSPDGLAALADPRPPDAEVPR